jgi:hypothetical protein
MPRGDKSAYTAKQKLQARHIAEGHRERGVSTENFSAQIFGVAGGVPERGQGRASLTNEIIWRYLHACERRT